MSRAALAILKLKLCLFANESFGGFENILKILWPSEFLYNMKVIDLEKLHNFHDEHFFIWALDQREILFYS